jgi:hypothetical protein
VIRTCLAVSLLLVTAACDQPSDYLPKKAVSVARTPLPRNEAIELVRDIVGPCERAMERASDAIGIIAASATPPAAARHPVALAKTICAGAFSRLQRSNASGEVRDACLAAAYARESVADTALEILEGRANAVAISTLQYKTADQAAASRACVAALARAG